MRRIGSTPQQRGSTTGANCPDVIELDDGSYLVIGKLPADGVIKAKGFVEQGFSVGPDEAPVIVPRDALLTAARQIVGEDAAGLTDARAAYQAYGAVTDFLNFRGDPMPRWEDLPSKIRAAWANAATGVRNRALMEAAEKLKAWAVEHLSGMTDGSWDAVHDAIAVVDPRDPRSLDG